VYVRRPPGFESEKYRHRVYKWRKALGWSRRLELGMVGWGGSCLREGLRYPDCAGVCGWYCLWWLV
jgi:hypothetical protein